MHVQLPSLTRDSLLLFVLLFVGSCFVYNRYCCGLHRFNGPILASFSGLWHIWQIWQRGDPVSSIALHKKYGKIVRMSPRTLSFSQPEAVRDIYGQGGLTQKSDFHLVPQQVANGKALQSMFATVDTKWHNDLKKRISGAFSIASMRHLEKYVDDTVESLIHQLEIRFANKVGAAGCVDFPKWIHYYTDDAVTAISYGTPIGHLEAGEDKFGLLASVNKSFDYIGLVAYMPSLDKLFWKNPILMWLSRHGYWTPKLSSAVAFAMEAQNRRRELRKANSQAEDGPEPLTDKFLLAQEKDPSVIGPREVLALALSIVVAGSGTTSVSLSALLYYSLRNPSVYQRLRLETDCNFPTNRSNPSLYTAIPFLEAQALPYLSAVIKETFRIHPSAAFAPERVVPPQGHTICGEHIPGGTIVGVNAWVLHRDTDIFGLDVDTFRPERWLEGVPDSLKRMERTLFHFGSGNFSCIGRNIANVEMYKVVPALLRRFDITLAYPEREWKIHPIAFVDVTDFDIRLTTRT